MRITQEIATSKKGKIFFKIQLIVRLGRVQGDWTSSCSAAASVWYHLLFGNNPPQLGKAANPLALTTLPSHSKTPPCMIQARSRSL